MVCLLCSPSQSVSQSYNPIPGQGKEKEDPTATSPSPTPTEGRVKKYKAQISRYPARAKISVEFGLLDLVGFGMIAVGALVARVRGLDEAPVVRE